MESPPAQVEPSISGSWQRQPDGSQRWESASGEEQPSGGGSEAAQKSVAALEEIRELEKQQLELLLANAEQLRQKNRLLEEALRESRRTAQSQEGLLATVGTLNGRVGQNTRALQRIA